LVFTWRRRARLATVASAGPRLVPVQVATAAAKVRDKSKGIAGICLRGLKGWGEMFAPLTTVVNTYGGTWFEKDWTAKVNAQPFWTRGSTRWSGGERPADGRIRPGWNAMARARPPCGTTPRPVPASWTRGKSRKIGFATRR
jgi:hypothetical protein